MRRFGVLLLSILILASGCTSADRVETIEVDAVDVDSGVIDDPTSAPAPVGAAAALAAAGDRAAADRTLSFIIRDDEGTAFSGQYSVTDGLTYALDAESMGFADASDDVEIRVVLNDDGVFVSSDFYALRNDVPGDLWVVQDDDELADEIRLLFDFLAGELGSIADDPTAIIAELTISTDGTRYSIAWPPATDPFPSFGDLELLIDAEGRIVEATIAEGDTVIQFELFDHGHPVDIPVPDKVVTEDELYEQVTIGSVDSEQPAASVRGVSDELDEVLGVAARSNTRTVLLLMTGWCSSVCEEQGHVVAEALAQTEEPPLVVLVVGGSGENLDRFSDLVPSALVIADPRDELIVRTDAAAVPALVKLSFSGSVLDILIGVTSVDEAQFFLEQAAG